jgi:hypothetical protein
VNQKFQSKYFRLALELSFSDRVVVLILGFHFDVYGKNFASYFYNELRATRFGGMQRKFCGCFGTLLEFTMKIIQYGRCLEAPTR